VPVPGEKNLLMPGSELAPELFTQVMNIKPGRQTGPGLPADALDQAEAQEFCRRLSWLLGTPVRLPTERESVSADAEKMSDATNWSGFRFVVEYPLPDNSP
jgi:formylglycine-generating enzyme required for sulfatase activity